jgi:hypothetical protein
MVVIIHYKPSIKLEIMHENDHRHRFRGFKLTISMSFGEFVFSAGFILKTVKGIKTSNKIVLIYSVNNSKRFQRTPEGNPRKHIWRGCLAPPAGRSVPWSHMSASASTSVPPPPPRLHLCHLFKSV